MGPLFNVGHGNIFGIRRFRARGRWRFAGGLFGLIVAAPISFIMAEIATAIGIKVTLHPYVVLGAAAITMIMALLAGLAALRSVQSVDPAHNIR